MGFVIKLTGLYENFEKERMFFEIAADHVIDGRIIAFPTSSVYGLGGDPINLNISDRLYNIKLRDRSKGFLLLISDIEEAKKIALFNDVAETLASHFWPGKLTLILKKKPNCIIPPEVTGNRDTIGLRVPKNFVISSILKQLKKKGAFGGIIGTSANIADDPPLYSGKEVVKQFSQSIYYIIDSGKTQSKIPTTIVDCTNKKIKILREGEISKEEIKRVI